MKGAPARYIGIIMYLALVVYLSGCGYTARSLISPEFKSIYVENFTNRINITQEQTDERMYSGYRPGLEIDVTKTIIDRFLFDGNLKVTRAVGDHDLILKGELVDFRKEALRYDTNDNVEEYRIRLVVNLELKSAKGDLTIWKEDYFSGEATYRTTGSLAKSESAAISDALSDLARRVVERTIEGW